MKDIMRAIVLCGIFTIPFIPLIVANSLFFPFITGKNFFFRIVVEIIFASYVLLALVDKTYRPRFSWTFFAFSGLVIVMFLADAFGVSAHKSFWSNYERMDGFITLAHLFLYFIVLGNTLRTEKLWNAFWNTTLLVAGGMALYGFGQIAGTFAINQSDFRLDSRMGNAAYLAVYMLFHTAIALLMLLHAKSRNLRIFYAVLAAAFVVILVATGTRGTVLGLCGGIFLTTLYIALYDRTTSEGNTPQTFFARIMARPRYIAVSGLIGLAIVVLGFVALKNQPIITENPTLSRIASTSFKELSTRLTIWNIALQGIKERPLLGWGQENFNYVFNKYYHPDLYGQEPWFDRVHNLAFDWLIAGGILGFLAYFFLLGTALYYILIESIWKPGQETFTLMERGVLLGLLGGYVAHNLLVFDNLISYILYASILAYIHMRVAEDLPVMNFSIDDRVIRQVALPVTAVALVAVVYFVNIPSLTASSDIIKALSTQLPDERYEAMETALSRGSFANQELREQLARISQSTLRDPNVLLALRQKYPTLGEQEIINLATELQQKYLSFADKEFATQLEETPNDARVLVLFSSYYRAIGKTDVSLDLLNRALLQSPDKQQILFEVGLTYLQAGNTKQAKEIMKKAFESQERYALARVYYIIAALADGDDALYRVLANPPEYPDFAIDLARNDMVLQGAYDVKRYDIAIELLNKRIELDPREIQSRKLLIVVQKEAGMIADAIATTKKAMEDFPDFKAEGEQYLEELK